MNKFRILKSVFFSAGLATSVLLGGCSSEETIDPGTPSGGGTKVARIGITKANASTRAGIAASSPLGSSHELTFGDHGFIFFVDNAGLVAKSLEIVKTDNDLAIDFENYDDYQVSLEALQSTAGVTFTVPDNSKKVYIYLNLPERVFNEIAPTTYPTSTVRNLEYLAGNRFASNVGSKLLSVDELADPQTFGVEKVPVSGSGELIEEEYYSEQYDYTANVVLQSMASRVEIQSIKLVAKNAETEIKSYELEAILINNFYAEANLDGAYTTELTNYGTNMHAYEEHHAQFNYKATHKSKYLFASGGLNGSNQPQPLGGDGTAFIKYPDPSEGLNPEDHTKVWGYNIFPNDLPGINTREYLPHIVIHLLNVTYDFDGSGTEYADETVNAQTDGAELWLTVRGYQDNAGKVQTFDRGIAYLIGGADGFEVNLEDFGLFPETPSNEDITVKVTATAIPWTTTVVEPSF